MIKTLIDRELKRLQKQGLDAVVVTDEFICTKRSQSFPLGADSAILTGVFFDDDTIVNDLDISISSATSCVSGKANRIASMGENIHKVMRQYIKVSRTTLNDSQVVINVIKICPKKQVI